MSDMEDDLVDRADAKKRRDVSTDDSSFEAGLSKYVDDNIVGHKTTFRGPFGRKRVVYCDSSRTGHFKTF
jgi:hypothetical protein